MWFDSFALLPLVALGVWGLVNEGKYRLYTVSLALSVFTNYYIGLYICIFTAITFFTLCVIQKLKARDFLHRLGLIAACSALALGMAAVFLIPTFSALRSGYSMPTDSFPAKLNLYNSFFDVLGNFIAFAPPTFTEGLPNLYCGMISILLAGLFIYSPKISRREKIVLTGTLVFLLISCNLNVLYYLWNGFRFPIKIPGRFSFLISFILIVMAYRAFLFAEHVNRRGLLAMGISAAVFLLAAVFGSQEKGYIIGSAVLCAVYLPLFYFAGRSTRVQRFIRAALLLVIVTELSATAYIAFKTAEITGRDEYPDRYEEIQALLDMRPRPSGEPGGVDFYRTDINYYFSFNDPHLYNYNGISFFASTIGADLVGFMRGLGLTGGGLGNNFFLYNETPPLTNAFLNMRYMISCGGYLADGGIYWETAGEAGDALLLENKRYLPLGFMVNEDITGYRHHDANPFLSQNDLFRRATGLDGSLFAITDFTGDTAAQNDRQGITTLKYEMPSDGMLYAYCKSYNKNLTVPVFVNGTFLHNLYILGGEPYLSSEGNFAQGDIVSFTVESDTWIQAAYLNSNLFERGYALLADETWNLTTFTDTRVSGHVTALKDGVLYTSIPGKNWNVFVDGIKSEIVLIDNAMAAVRLKAGVHTVEFRYFNKSLTAGIIVSLASLAVFAALVLRDTFKRRGKGSGKIIKSK